MKQPISVLMTKSLVLMGLTSVSMLMSDSAEAVTYIGNTTGQSTWNRPLSGNPPTNLSGVGTATPYESQPFYVTADGAYDFLSTATDPASWDNYTFLYANNFDPNSQFTNVIIGNDDFPGVGLSGFNGVALTANTQYFFVTTGFGNGDFGEYTGSISGGAGDVILGSPTAIPLETDALPLVFSGLFIGGGVWFKRKRSQTKVSGFIANKG